MKYLVPGSNIDTIKFSQKETRYFTRCFVVRDIYIAYIFECGKESSLRFKRINRGSFIIGIEEPGGIEIGGQFVKHKNSKGHENYWPILKDTKHWPGVYRLDRKNGRFEYIGTEKI